MNADEQLKKMRRQELWDDLWFPLAGMLSGAGFMVLAMYLWPDSVWPALGAIATVAFPFVAGRRGNK